MKSPQLPKAKKLVSVARHSIGLTEGLGMARLEINTLLRQYRLIQDEVDILSEQLTVLAQRLTDYEYLASVPGVGDGTIVELLSEVGTLTQYEHPRQLIKLAGLTLRESSSGQHKGQKRISKRGRRKLRALLFRVMIPILSHNTAFKKLHNYYTTRNVNPLKKKQSIVLLCGKLLKILHGLCKKQVLFDERLMMKDLSCLEEAA
jgi:transposase